jgi:hypothetical protein
MLGHDAMFWARNTFVEHPSATTAALAASNTFSNNLCREDVEALDEVSPKTDPMTERTEPKAHALLTNPVRFKSVERFWVGIFSTPALSRMSNMILNRSIHVADGFRRRAIDVPRSTTDANFLARRI